MKGDFLELMKEQDKLETAMGERARAKRISEAEVQAFIDLITNVKGHKSYWHKALVQEAETTSDFPLLFGTVLERTLLAKYKGAVADWREYIGVGTQNDFRSANLLAVYGLNGQLSEVQEQGEYQAAALADGRFSISLKKYGRRFGLSWESMINDDLGALNDVAERLAQACVRTEGKIATGAFVSSSGPNSTLFSTSGTHPIDGTTFVNKDTKVLDGDGIAATITAMSSQKDDQNEPILISRFHLVVPPGKYITALKALSDKALIASGVGSSAAFATSDNVIAKLPITLHVNPYLPIIDTTHGDTSWYMFADPKADGEAVRVNFLRGHENPEICSKASNKETLSGQPISQSEGDFDNDSANWRARHVMGVATLDPRFAYAQAATS